MQAATINGSADLFCVNDIGEIQTTGILVTKINVNPRIRLESFASGAPGVDLAEISGFGASFRYVGTANEGRLIGNDGSEHIVAKWDVSGADFLPGVASVTDLGSGVTSWRFGFIEEWFAENKSSSPGVSSGRVWVQDGKLNSSDGTSEFRAVHRVAQKLSTQTFTNVNGTDFTTIYSIPANALSIGSTVSVYAVVECTQIDGGAGIGVRLGGVDVEQGPNGGETVIVQASMTVRSLGALGVAWVSGTTRGDNVISPDTQQSSVASIDTTGALLVELKLTGIGTADFDWVDAWVEITS